MNTKAIIASTLLTAIFAGQTAIAGDNDHFAAADYAVQSETVVMQKVSLNSDVITTITAEESGRK